MEEILDLYHKPYDPLEPVVCLDEGLKQLIGEVKKPIPMKPGQPKRYDYEYEKHGTSNQFMLLEPLASWRHVIVTESRTAIDYAHVIKEIVDVLYPDADCIHIVEDNLNTHKRASLYKAFEPEEAHRILQKVQFHKTPVHGSWLNMAEIELHALNTQCLNRRIDDRNYLIREVKSWEDQRNHQEITVDWQFQTADARIKLKKLYPSIHS